MGGGGGWSHRITPAAIRALPVQAGLLMEAEAGRLGSDV